MPRRSAACDGCRPLTWLAWAWLSSCRGEKLKVMEVSNTNASKACRDFLSSIQGEVFESHAPVMDIQLSLSCWVFSHSLCASRHSRSCTAGRCHALSALLPLAKASRACLIPSNDVSSVSFCACGRVAIRANTIANTIAWSFKCKGLKWNIQILSALQRPSIV